MATKSELARIVAEERIRYKALLQLAGDGVHIVDAAGKLIEFSDSFAAMLGYTNEEMAQLQVSDWDMRYAPQELPAFIISMLEGTSSFETRHRRKDGSVIHVGVTAKGIELGGELYLYASSRDITAQKQAQEEIYNHNASLEILLNSTHEGLLVFDTTRHCIKANRAAAELLGYELDELYGKHILHHVADESLDLVKAKAQMEITPPFEGMLKRKDGSHIEVLLRGRDLHLWSQDVRLVGILDITEFKNAQRQIEQMALYDVLTGLPNRHYLHEALERSIARCKRFGFYGALLFIDLDHFKTINDTRGHEVGDQVLVEVAKRMKNSIRGNDIVFRIGGDEFVILVEIPKKETAGANHAVEQMAVHLVEMLHAPMELGDDQFYLSGSIGIVLISGEENAGDLMKFADSAMYRAKHQGRDTFCFFDPKVQNRLEERMMLTRKLREAIHDQGIMIYCQEQVYYDQAPVVVGAEVLLRWYDEQLGWIPPSRFIPLAEESGLIILLGSFVLEEGMKLLEQWSHESEKCQRRLSINISPRQFEREDFVENIHTSLKHFTFDPAKLRLEITEGLLIENMENARNKIDELKELGISLSIDDFGTGYSSLSYLKNLPLDELKIDQSFVHSISEHSKDNILINTIISIGHQFGLEVIAEGVENEQQLQKLLEMGCRNFQGFLFARPHPVEAP